MTRQRLTRRQVLSAAGGAGSVGVLTLLAACGGAAGTTTAATTGAAGSPTATSASQVSLATSTTFAATTSVSVAPSTSATTIQNTTATTAVSSSTSTAVVSASSRLQPAGQSLAFLWVDTGQQSWRDVWQQLLQTWSATSKVTVTRDTVVFADAPQKVLTTVAGGGYYDYLYGYFGWLPDYVTKQVIQPLDQFLAKDSDIAVAGFYPAMTERYQGKLYGIAWSTNGKDIWYNADLFRQAGLTTPLVLEQAGNWTWRALLDAAQKLTKSSSGQTTVYGFDSSAFPSFPEYWMVMWAWGAAPYTADFGQATFDTAAQQSALQFAGDMALKYKVIGGGDFTKSTLAMLMTGPFYNRTVQASIVRTNPFTLEIAPLPKGPSGERAVAVANNCNYIGAAAKLPEQAWALNKYLLSAAGVSVIAQLGDSRYVASKKLKPITQYPYENAALYEQDMARVRPAPLIAKEAGVETDWAGGWKSLIAGKLAVKEMLTDMQQKATIALQQGGCVC